MKKNKNRQQLIFLGIYSSLVLSALGSMAGTYAWFTYTGRIVTHFHGTSLNKSSTLRVGLVSDIDLPKASQYGLTKDATKNIYWSDEGISAKALSYFFNASGYAGGGAEDEITHPLIPVTSGNYQTNDTFKLFHRPTTLKSNVGVVADKNNYLQIPLVFEAKNDKQDYLSDYEVRLTEVELKDSSRGNLSQAIRINFDNNDGNNFIFNPTANRDGKDVIGGVLDTDLDGYFDYDPTTMKEYIYGEYDHIEFDTTPSQGEQPKPIEERTVFNAKHAKDIYAAMPDSTSYKTSSYLGKSSVLSKKDVATINDGLAYTTITIYEEGWSSNAIDNNIQNIFDLKLTFEIYNEHEN